CAPGARGHRGGGAGRRLRLRCPRPRRVPQREHERTAESAAAAGALIMGAQRPLAYATPDLDRERRQGLPEVIYGPGKTAAEIKGIAQVLLHDTVGPVLVTRLDPAKAAMLSELGGEYDA